MGESGLGNESQLGIGILESGAQDYASTRIPNL